MSNDSPQRLSIALVYDRVTVEHGGAEDVLKALHQAFPTAPLFTSVVHSKLNWTKDWQIRPSFLQKIPFAPRFHRLLAPLMPIAFETHNFSGFDIVLSVSSAEAKGVLTTPEQLHLCYLFTPTRYLYEYANAYGATEGWHNWLIIKSGITLVRRYLTWWDKQAALRPDSYITLSQKSVLKIKSIYQRSAKVVYPPVTMHVNKSSSLFNHQQPPFKYALSLSRLVAYKKVKDGILACYTLNIPIIIVGSGPDFNRLTALHADQTHIRSNHESIQDAIRLAIQNNKHIIFMGTVTNAERSTLLGSAKVLLMLGDEDFGISAIQAAVQGIPTIVSSHSGASELLKNFSNSIQLRTITNTEVCTALKTTFQLKQSPVAAQELARQTSGKFFIRQMQEIVYDEWRKHMKKYDNIQKGE